MAFADFWGPLLSQIRFCTVLGFLRYWCPSDIKLQMFIPLYLWIHPVFGYAILDISLTDVHHLGVWSSVPNYIDARDILVEILMV